MPQNCCQSKTLYWDFSPNIGHFLVKSSGNTGQNKTLLTILTQRSSAESRTESGSRYCCTSGLRIGFTLPETRVLHRCPGRKINLRVCGIFAARKSPLPDIVLRGHAWGLDVGKMLLLWVMCSGCKTFSGSFGEMCHAHPHAHYTTRRLASEIL